MSSNEHPDMIGSGALRPDPQVYDADTNGSGREHEIPPDVDTRCELCGLDAERCTCACFKSPGTW